MATITTVPARTTASLTGGATVDYGADLDMNLTADGWVTVEIVPTIGGLVSITLATYAGPAATPTGIMLTDAMVPNARDMVAETGLTCTFSVHCNSRYFRAGIAGAGGAAAGSDAVINYYYQTKASVLVGTAATAGTLVDGGLSSGAATLSHI